MQIEETYVSDTNFDATQASKLLLMEEIIDTFIPLFSEEIERKKKRLRESKQDYAKLRQVVSDETARHKELRSEYEKEKKIEKILENAEVLMNHNVLYGKNKDRVGRVLINVSSMSIDELDKSIRLLTKLMQQNIQRVIT